MKMIPRTLIRYSTVYNRVFDANFSKKDFLKLKKDCLKFEKLYKKHINEILELIEKYASKKWKYKFIPIYIVKTSSCSFSDPLTLRFRKDEKYLLISLAHELLHNNIRILKGKYKDRKDLHLYMESILDKVILGLDKNLEPQLKKYNKQVHKMYGIDY